MKLKILCWNVRGANDSSRRKLIKAVVRSQKVDLLCIQETKIKSMSEGWLLELLEWEEGQFSISCRFRKVEDGTVWVFTGVYGPFTKNERDCMWDEIGAIRGLWEEPWCVGGDFNVILSQNERNRQGRISAAMRKFAQVIDELGLIDLPLQGVAYFKKVSRPVSDHFPVVLEGGTVEKRSFPFRFENMWLKVEGFQELIQSWWQGIEVRGSASFRLATKMKAVKQKLKVWNREVFGRLEDNKAAALQLVDHWDMVESGRRLSEEETISKRKQRIVMLNWKADIERLQLEQLNQQEAENLEHPFSEEEIHRALMEMNGDKARTDEFTKDFGKDAGL
ncbi:hypothetical protein CK203_112210 [Vitis vinifera]|uniref:Endonuclease/exonuclease/phosphatase domain-containing protein n=1 Tax=Vitis vinifera TaxID=29760 RepID=A0A438D087_VITVI|nr:hypothetical protein CK203_112210 [Vitis vinifera]